MSAVAMPANALRTSVPTIVGVGCSAGGLEALESFFGHVPAGCPLAFVVVQHLAPTHTSALPELLQRVTTMAVQEASDGMPVQPACIYVIPPNKDLGLHEGVLQVQDPLLQSGLHLSVDHFFCALAEDRHERAIGVVLSGMGSDGVVGLRAIHRHGGLALAQDPTTAQSASMPASAIAAAMVDIVAPASQLVSRILAYLQCAPPKPGAETPLPASDLGVLERITQQLRERGGTDFALYKPSTLLRRIERRVALQGMNGLDSYAAHLAKNPHELDLLFKEMLIGVTQFFRDPAVWALLLQELIPRALVRHPAGHHFRAWVAACSTGEEAYTLAMVFREAVAATPSGGRHTLQIYATDLDPDAIARARRGRYASGIAVDVGAERLALHFTAEDDGWSVAKAVRDMVVFATQDLIRDPPFTKLDWLCCRNLLIYFRPELQGRLLPLFHYALNPGGTLVLGNAETVGTQSALFAPEAAQAHVFRRLDPAPAYHTIRPVIGPVPEAPLSAQPLRGATESLGALTDQLIQQTYAPAAVLVNAAGDILYISGRTGRYLEPAAGKVNINIHAMARPGLAQALTGLIQQALREARTIVLRGVQVHSEGGKQPVDLTVQALEQPPQLQGRVLIVFKEALAPPAARRRRKAVTSSAHEALAQELQQLREALSVTREESQSAMEELKSANEELQSTNEELQSTNEELTTSKEEMQSMNEELQTVNTELQDRVKDFTWERNDMSNLLNSTGIATIFLDSALKLRRYTPFATQLFKLIPGDIGRPLSDLVSDLDYPQLKTDAQDVLHTLVFCEKQLPTLDGRWFRVRTMPYRSHNNVIDGVVSTFVDITETKALEAKLRLRQP